MAAAGLALSLSHTRATSPPKVGLWLLATGLVETEERGHDLPSSARYNLWDPHCQLLWAVSSVLSQHVSASIYCIRKY